jgi:hypothetical protein
MTTTTTITTNTYTDIVSKELVGFWWFPIDVVMLVAKEKTQLFDHCYFSVTHSWHPSKPNWNETNISHC